MTATQTITNEISTDQGLFRSIWYLGGLLKIHVDGTDTNGQFSLIEAYSTPGMEPPMHVHQNEDELFYILDGELTAFCGVRTIKAKRGDSVFLPRRIPHTFRIESETARALILVTPSGFENYFREIGRPAEQETLPPSPIIPDLEHIMRTANEYGVDFTGR
jgi:quercetin dioxygenase-like cupin family protein